MVESLKTMAGFKLYTSNRLESLLDALASVVGEPLSSPFESEVIVVQSKGMERWLSMELAKEFGIWMNCRFPFPNKFVWEMFNAVIHDIPDISQYSPQVMTWSIMRLLPEHLHTSDFDVINNYLVQESDHMKRLQLSERVADVFDKYSIYRPEMVLRWDEGSEGAGQSESWQAQLWRGLFESEIGKHRAGILRDFLKLLTSPKVKPGKLPERISIFGIPAFPRYHFEVINALASLIDVHFFLLSPTREYWADIVPEKKIGADTTGLLHFEVGNQLLASMGKLGRDFFSMIVNRNYEEFPSFREPDGESLLACLQSDILHLKTRDIDQKTAIQKSDRSVQIHSCHSPMREVEVLYDNLLELFETRPGLTPKDIIVMTPDIEAYAPYITAIFSAGQDDKMKIPFSIADRKAFSESHVIDVFLRIINLKGGRLRAPEIIDLLDCPVIQVRFGFKAEDMELILRWVNETHIRWGIDGVHRERIGLPVFDEGSWKAGIKRLLLGYTLRGNEERLFNDILPYDDIEGNETEVLGRFLEFLSCLFSSVNELEGKHVLAEWAVLLESLLTRFFVEDQENQREMQILRTKIRDLISKQALSGFTEPVELEVIRYYLSKQLKDEELSIGFMTGAVTFCEMLPMRSIPFRVIALIGMNSDAYPREYRPVGFDLIAHDPQPGDRSLRDEDRYLFLEAILSSRECLYISHVGQSIRDNSELPPSVLVSELIDHIDQGFHVAEGEIPRDHIVQQHRLQPFSPAYFSGKGRLFSFSHEDCEAAKVKSDGRAKLTPFISKPLTKTAAENKDISITDLKRFFRNPSRYFLNHRLGIYLEEGSTVPEDQEPLFQLNALEKFKLKDWLTSKKMAGNDLRGYYALVKGGGILPPATPGKVVYQEISQVVDAFYEELRSHTDSEKLPPLDVDIRIDDFRITGRLEHIWKSTLVEYQCVEKDRARHHLDVWIDHIVLNCARKPKYPQGSIFVRIGSAWFFNPIEDARSELKKLLSFFLNGMTEPLRFFPQTSAKYAERFIRVGHEDALHAARNDWEVSDFNRGEGGDPYFKLCFDHVDPLDDTFASIALDVFGPLIKNRDKMNKLKR
jgi:exodeoxyribonuclease V gamma subunit